jgi:DNA-binding beta-propeller fold protein YncE
MRAVWTCAILLSGGLPSAGASAYVVATGVGYDTPGSITPVNASTGTPGAPFFAPAGGNSIAIAPGTKEIWETTTAPGCSGTCQPPFAINVLDPKSGAMLASIPLTAEALSVVFDPGGKYAYSAPFNEVVKIDVASRAILQTAAGYGGYLAISGDGSKLFLTLADGVEVIDTQTLNILTTLQIAGGVNSASSPAALF